MNVMRQLLRQRQCKTVNDDHTADESESEGDKRAAHLGRISPTAF